MLVVLESLLFGRAKFKATLSYGSSLMTLDNIPFTGKNLLSARKNNAHYSQPSCYCERKLSTLISGYSTMVATCNESGKISKFHSVKCREAIV